jgi:hypothetical protein
MYKNKHVNKSHSSTTVAKNVWPLLVHHSAIEKKILNQKLKIIII